MKHAFIYSLNCPISGAVKYIGKSIDPNKRYTKHLSGQTSSKVCEWINSLIVIGEKPILHIIEKCEHSEWQEREAYWISFYGLPNLLNTNKGGDLGPVIQRGKRVKILRKPKQRICKHVDIQSIDFLILTEVSTHLTGKRDNIRKDVIPKKYHEQVKELTDFIEYWKQKTAHP